MAKLWYGHFNSVAGDRRELLAEGWANYMKSFISTGIRNGGTCLQVTNKEQMFIKIDEGIANLEGYIFILERDSKGRYWELEVEPSHNRYDRIDRVVLRLDINSTKRSIEPMILRGTASGNPVPPSLTRNSLVYDISLAQIRVKANTLVINRDNITDERFNEDVCGLINSVLGLDSSIWQKQFDNFMETVKGSNEDLANVFREEFNASQDDRQIAFEQRQSEIEDWYTSVKLDITKLQTFNFDNLAELKGTTKTTKKLVLTNKDIQVNIKVYERNGVDIMKNVTVVTRPNSDESITEVVS